MLSTYDLSSCVRMTSQLSKHEHIYMLRYSLSACLHREIPSVMEHPKFVKDIKRF